MLAHIGAIALAPSPPCEPVHMRCAPMRRTRAHCAANPISPGQAGGKAGQAGGWSPDSGKNPTDNNAGRRLISPPASTYSRAVQAILDHGHVVEGHGYNHEIARYLPRDEEDQVMKKTIAMVHKRTGRRCYGWRSCTQSTNTIELLIENGFVFNTKCFHEE